MTIVALTDGGSSLVHELKVGCTIVDIVASTKWLEDLLRDRHPLQYCEVMVKTLYGQEKDNVSYRVVASSSGCIPLVIVVLWCTVLGGCDVHPAFLCISLLVHAAPGTNSDYTPAARVSDAPMRLPSQTYKGATTMSSVLCREVAT